MNTVTHLLVNAAIDRRVRERDAAVEGRRGPDATPGTRAHPIATKAFLWGGVAPDLPLIAMTVGAAAWFTTTRGWSLGESLRHVFRDLYFSNSGWKAANNVLQAPFMLLAWYVLALLVARRWPDTGHTLRWFVLGMAVHVAFDIPLHHDDGPLILFPFDWDARFRSPISYWDPRHHGGIVGTVEYLVVGALALYLLRGPLGRWWRRVRA